MRKFTLGVKCTQVLHVKTRTPTLPSIKNMVTETGMQNLKLTPNAYSCVKSLQNFPIPLNSKLGKLVPKTLSDTSPSPHTPDQVALLGLTIQPIMSIST